jgi:hypothetical protein
MAEPLTIAAAARLCQCDRRTLQRAIHAGRLHLDAQHRLSRDELMATGYLMPATPQETPQTALLLVALERLALAIERLSQAMQAHDAYVPARSQETPQKTPRGMPQSTPRPTPQAGPQAGSAYDATRYVLGALCPRGHEYAGTGHSLRRRHNGGCAQCNIEQQRDRRAARRRGPQGDKALGG